MKTGPAVIACLLLVLGILLALPLVIYAPRPIVFPMHIAGDPDKGAPPRYIGVSLELEAGEVQAAKSRMQGKVARARALLAVAEEEEQQAEDAFYHWAETTTMEEQGNDPTARGAADHEEATWGWDIARAKEVTRKAEVAVGAVGDDASLSELKRAGRLANECLWQASEAEVEMRRRKESYEETAARGAHGGV